MQLDALVVGVQVEITFNLNRIKTGFIKHKGLIIK
jgi:hypothetical protein